MKYVIVIFKNAFYVVRSSEIISQEHRYEIEHVAQSLSKRYHENNRRLERVLYISFVVTLQSYPDTS